MATPGTNTDRTQAALDPARVLADPDGCAALSELVHRLRAIGYDGTPGVTADAARIERWAPTLVALASGRTASEQDTADALGSDAATALVRCGALARLDGDLCLTARIFAMRTLYTFLPRDEPGQDLVYLGRDSLVLFETIWAARGYGDRAVDLATGNGFIAAALATRYDHVIAGDLSRRCVSTAALIPVVNPHLRSRFAAVQMDVAHGLRPGSFDLVTANAPWVPETVGPNGGPPRRFAAGGPTGFELPRRFIDAAVELLAPGGRAFIACLDIAFDDGRRPLLDHLRPLSAGRLEVMITETRLNDVFEYDAWAARRAHGATSAKHVVVELQVPS